MRIIPDYFREMAKWTMSLVNRASDAADRSHLDSVARTYCELADEAEQAYLPFEPARVYAPSLYVELADDPSTRGLGRDLDALVASAIESVVDQLPDELDLGAIRVGRDDQEERRHRPHLLHDADILMKLARVDRAAVPGRRVRSRHRSCALS